MAMGDAGDALAEKMLDWMMRDGQSVFRWLLNSGIRPSMRGGGSRRGAEGAADAAREAIDADLAADAGALELTDGVDEEGNLVLWAPDRDTAKRIREAVAAEGMEARIGKKEAGGIMRVTVMSNAESRGREAGDQWEPLDLDSPAINELRETYTFAHARSTACAWAAIDALRSEVAERYTQVEFDPSNAERNVTFAFVTKVVGDDGRTVVDDPEGRLLMDALDRAGVASEAWPDPEEDVLRITFDARQTPLVHDTIHAMCREVPHMSVSRFPGYGRARYEGMEKLASSIRETGAADQIEMSVPKDFSPDEVARALASQGIPAIAPPVASGSAPTVVVDEAAAIAHQQEIAEYLDRARLSLGPDPLASEPPTAIAAKFDFSDTLEAVGASRRAPLESHTSERSSALEGTRSKPGRRHAPARKRIELPGAADDRFAVRRGARPEADEAHARSMAAAVNRARQRVATPERTVSASKGRT